MSKNPYKLNLKTICIEIPIEPTKYLHKFILDNAYMYHKIRNDFVEEANKYIGKYNMYDEFDPLEFKSTYYRTVEIPEHRYDKYCVGLSEMVSQNFKIAKKSIRTKNRKAFDRHMYSSIGSFKFKKFDINRYTFRVKLKPKKRSPKTESRLKIKDKYNISFTVRSNRHTEIDNRDEEIIDIKLKEPLYNDILKADFNNHTYYRKYNSSNGIINDCMFKLLDIKDICFKYELGNYYIQLFTDVCYCIDKRSRKYTKHKVVGIDTGIRHPITIYDGENVKYIQMPDSISKKIHYLERRIARLQHVNDRKRQYNIEHNIDNNSKNIIKINNKCRKLYKKIVNIKHNWAKCTAKNIVMSYDTIVLDDFEQPYKKLKENIPMKARHRMNYVSLFHCMSYVNDFIIHDADKYGCKYIKSPEDTTRTCSECGYVNAHPKLSDKVIVCSCCGATIERDLNAAKNCYNYALSL